MKVGQALMPVKCRRTLFALLLLLLCLGSLALAANPSDNEGNERPEDVAGREQWFMKGRTFEGKPASQLLNRAQQQRETMRREAYRRAQVRSMAISSTSVSTTVSTPVWSPLGPAPMNSIALAGEAGDYGLVTGRATTVVVDQNDTTGNTVYVGGAYGGLWKSTTAANTDPSKVLWTPIIDDQATIAVGSMAIQPGNSNVLLVGTGEAHSSADSYYGLGILRSEDGGNSWSLINTADNGTRVFHGLAFAKIAFSTDNPNIVVAAAASASQGITVGAEAPNYDATRGIYYSQDSGKTWFKATMSDGTNGTPMDGSVSSVFFNPIEHKFYAAFRAHGFYVSTDAVNWTRMGFDQFGFTQPISSLNFTNCPTLTANVVGCPLYRGEITQVPGRNEMYVVVVNSDDANQGVFRTLDGGKTWTSISTSGMVNCGDSSGCNTTQGTYNLALTAVPNNTSTDLYVGAVNIFRCTIPSGTASCSFANLTHVYGCNVAKVHPDQHSFDYSLTHPEIMYFANDGGINRTLSSTTPTIASCSGTNTTTLSFQNLNGTMGSMTQFVWFSQHPTVQTTLLGGTQDNGSPMVDASYSGTNGVMWRSVMGGDGGFNDINPNNPNERYASYPVSPSRVYVGKCTQGDSCRDALFDQVVSSTTLKGDSASFYMPYTLDPQDSGKLIMGTCRVWRSTTSGGSAVALSQNFATGDNSTCSAGSSSFVSSLAAGGPMGASGSQVIYAGTDSGKVFFTDQANSATVTWTQISNNGAFSNPYMCGGTDSRVPCPISGIAIDPRDISGLTAYVTVMGFNTPHVWQTTDGGKTWSDISGNLPDAPADGVVVYKADGTIYVGTDVGVYSTNAPAGSSTVWTEVGPATGTGTLPNVAITRLAIFAPPSAPARLRVSTYGRGVWETPLAGSAAADFTVAVSDPDQVVFSGQTATYHGTITKLNGYNNSIALSCDSANGGAVPSTCTPSTIASDGTFTITLSNPSVQDFSFRILAVGTDSNTLTRQVPVSLRVVDFTIGAPQPSSITNLPHGNSTTVQVQVTSQGSFNAPVIFGCSGQPAGWTCTAAQVTPQPGGTATATITINTDATTNAPQTYAFSIVASSAGLETAKEQAVSVAVINQPNFNLGSAAFSNTPAKLTQALQGSFTISTVDGYTGPVNLSCTGAAQSGIPATACVFSLTQGGQAVTSVTPGTDPLVVFVSVPTTSPAVAGNGQMTVQATDGTITKSATLPFSITDYTLGNFSAPANVVPGGSTSFNFQLTPVNGYTGTVALACDASALPVNATCTLNPASPISLTPGTTTSVLASLSVPQGETPGTYAVTINTADQTVASLIHNQSTADFQVLPPPDFSLNASVATDTVIRGGTSNMTLQVTGQNTPSTVTYSISGCPQNATCMMSPPNSQTIVGTAVTSTLSVATQTSTPVGLYTITVTGTSGTATHTATFTLHVVDYTIDFGTTSSATVTAGQSTTAPINFVANTGDATFNAQVTFTLAGCPTRSTCSVSPNPFNPSTASQPPSLKIATTASSTASLHPSRGGTTYGFWLSLPFGVFGVVILRRHRAAAGMLVVTCTLLLGLSACGGGGGGSTTPPPTFKQGTPSGTYTITVTGTSGTTVKTANFTLTVQ